MKRLTILFVASAVLAACAPAWSEELDYGDYIEAFNTSDQTSTFYIYRSTIKKKSGRVSFSALEVKNKLDTPVDKKGEPYLALKYRFKYDCAKKQYTEAMTGTLQIESGWKKIFPEQVEKGENTWRKLTNPGDFNGVMMKTFCK
jgi:hypothetical protein